MARKTSFHAASDQLVEMLSGSRKLFSNLTDVFSAMAASDFTNDWAPELAERCFKFNRAQKRFQHDYREWANSITEDDWNRFLGLFGGGVAVGESPNAVRSAQAKSAKQGGDLNRKHSRKTVVSGKVHKFNPKKRSKASCYSKKGKAAKY